MLAQADHAGAEYRAVAVEDELSLDRPFDIAIVVLDRRRVTVVDRRGQDPFFLFRQGSFLFLFQIINK